MAINIKKIGHVGFLVSDFERSYKFYTEVLGCTLTNRRKLDDGTERAFLRFDEDHHNIVIATAPKGTDVSQDGVPVRLIQQIAMEVENRDEFFKALAHLHSRGVEPVAGPTLHGIEGDGKNLGGSGSRSFYFLDPDGNRLEIFTDGMKVPNGEEFPRPEYLEAMKAFSHS